MIPENIVDDIRRQADIVEIVSEHVRLKKRGKNYIGLCPFHTEKTPSFNVNPSMQVYKCFGCGKGGNVFTFLMEMEKVSFVEAAKSLARRVGVQIPDERRRPDEVATPFEKLYEVLTFAGNYFYTNLYSDDRHAKFIREDYFKGQRGLTDAMIKTFGLGASPDGWDILLYAARQEGFTEEILEHAGLIRRREDGSGCYDAFRDRAMFPITNATGRVVGFGARKVFDDDPLAKYINSPESPVYVKNKILYGLFQAKDAIRKDDIAFMVEGYMDLISLHQHGVINVVASSGTSLTEGQAELLARYTKNVVIVYDADNAGAAAAMRGTDILLERGMHVKVLTLPKGDDPDSFVRREGEDVFRRLAASADSFVTYKAAQLKGGGKFESPEQMADAVKQIVQTVAKIPDAIERSFTLRTVAETFDLYETDLLRELDAQMKAASAHPRRERAIAPPDEVMPPEMEAPLAPLSGAEEDLLRALIRGGPKVAEYVFATLQPEDLHHPIAHQLSAMIQEEIDIHGEVSYERLMEHADDDGVRRFLASLPFDTQDVSVRWDTMSRPSVDPDVMQLARDSVRALRMESLDAQMRDVQSAMKRGGDERAMAMAMMEINREREKLAKEKRR